LFTGSLELGGIEAWNLDKDPLGALWRNDRLTNAELVDALTDDLDRLLEHVRGDLLAVLWHQLQKEGGAASQIKS
jgi:hypothetical protein